MATPTIQIKISQHPMDNSFIAHWGDYDLDDPQGFGATVWEALQDLVENSSPSDYEAGEL